MKTKLMTVLAIAGIALAACNSNRKERMDDTDTIYNDTLDVDSINRGNNRLGEPDTMLVPPMP